MRYSSAIIERDRCGAIVALAAEPVVLSRPNPVRRSVRGTRKGIAATELAVLLPFLAFIFVVAIDFGRIFYYSLTIENCALAGAEYGSACFNNYDEYAGTQTPPGQPSDANIQNATISDGTSLSPPLTTSMVTVTHNNDKDGNPAVQVNIQYNFTTITNFPGIAYNTLLNRTVQMRLVPATPNLP
jgi:Flp pilus assembly protein TadG